MSTVPPPARPSTVALWIGRVISALPVLMLTMSGVMKLIKLDFLIEGFAKMELNDSLALPLGILELFCVALYVFPPTAVLGAILITGYMGGAILTHLRLGEDIYVQVGLGVLAWLGLYLREPRLRALAPWRRKA
jgi:hypothetical protein